jgi:Zn finger protein HypA/HybF involved in hydrogenase expression
MSQRNGQNPVRMERTFKKERGKFKGASDQIVKAPGTMQCPACGADVPPKPGFRMQSLKCPKCGTAMRK